MKAEDFVKKIQRSIVDDNIESYKDLFRNTKNEDTTDEYWKEASDLFQKFDAAGEKVFFKILRQIMVDTISSLFSVLDGMAPLDDEQAEEFKLVTEENQNDQLNGDLLDLFLEAEEEIHEN